MVCGAQNARATAARAAATPMPAPNAIRLALPSLPEPSSSLVVFPLEETVLAAVLALLLDAVGRL